MVPSPQRRSFATTRWSVVLSAGRTGDAEAAAAMETLCRTYWYPLYAYVRRRGNSPHDAQDLTQAFFARLLEKEWLAGLQPEGGRFRSFLLTALQRFLANDYDHRTARKRGGGMPLFSLDAEDAETRFAAEPALGPDAMFDRRWAMTLLEQTLAQLRAENARDFEALKPWLTADRGEIPYATLAAQMQCSEGAARVALHRLRKRFRELFRAAIAETLADPAELDAELRYIAAILGSSA